MEKKEEKLIAYRITSALLMLILLLSIGTFIFHKTESWSYVDSFYFSTMTITTIGYGDFVPTTTFGKIFISIYSILGIALMLFVFSIIIKIYLREQNKIAKIFSGVKEIEKDVKEVPEVKKKARRNKKNGK